MSSAFPQQSLDPQGRAQLIRWIARHSYGRSDAEDLFQEAFVRYEQCRRRGRVDNPVGFLLRTAANLAIDEHRKRRHLSAQPLDIACKSYRDPAPSVDDTLVARARLTRVCQGLAALGTRTREIFLMHRLDGHKQHDIAAALGISRSAVEKHIAKADGFLISWMEGW